MQSFFIQGLQKYAKFYDNSGFDLANNNLNDLSSVEEMKKKTINLWKNQNHLNNIKISNFYLIIKLILFKINQKFYICKILSI